MAPEQKWAKASTPSFYRGIASDGKASIEEWKGKDGIKFVYRNSAGQFQSWGTLEFESWSSEEKSQWVARLDNGKFVTGFTGELEKFEVGGDKEQLRVVFRNAEGEFVTWKAMDDLITGGFESMDLDGDKDGETVYVLRYRGKFVNWAKAQLETWKNFDNKVLVVRDSEDGKDNGKILAWIAPEKVKGGNVVYRDPATGRFVSPNN
jgi:hypothetical protein